ncbi:MAG: RNA polymerase sigma factor [Kofleriaceae bacterium]|nr:RNA polymerase sigma factor [Kofleriaceae bacterium]
MSTEPIMMEASPTDEELFLRYQARGDLESFGQLYDRYGPALFRFLRRFLGDRAAAEDLTQHAFLRIHEARASFDAQRSFRTWAFTIARRLALNWLDRERRAAKPSVHNEASDPAPSPERMTIVRREVEQLRRAFAKLPREDVEVVLLAKYEGLSHQQIGEIVGCSADAAKMRLHRALKRLAEQLPNVAKRSTG